MRFGLNFGQHHLTWDEILSRTQTAEALGFEGAWIFDHFKPISGGDPDDPCLEGWTLLAALAAKTSRIRLGTLVTGVTYRHPSVLAAEAITVDHISNGRLDIGMGAAWFEGEHRQLGISFPRIRERAERLEEAILVMRLLMTLDNITFEGEHYRLENATYRPRPVQQPTPPIWVGAQGEKRTIRIAAELADVWHADGDFEVICHKARVLDGYAEAAGRDPKSIMRASSLSLDDSWDDIRARIRAWQGAGFSYLVVGWPGVGRARVEEFARTVMPEFA